MNKIINSIALVFLVSCSPVLSLYAMQLEKRYAAQEEKDLLSLLFKEYPRELTESLLHEIASAETLREACKSLFSLACTSSFFREFLQDKQDSIDLVKYLHKRYPVVSRSDLAPLLLFINTDVARTYYCKEYVKFFDLSNSHNTGVPFSRVSNFEISVSLDDLLTAIKEEKLHDVRLLARLGASFRAKKLVKRDNYRFSCTTNPLEAALLTNNKKLLKLCIEVGKLADYFFDALRLSESQFPGYQSITHHRLDSEIRLKFIEAFVELGVDVNGRDYLLRTPLHIAMGANNGNNGDVVKFLLENGADINLCDVLGNIPLDVAYGNLRTSLRTSPFIIILRSYFLHYYTAKYCCFSQMADLETFLIVEHLCSLLSFFQQRFQVAQAPNSFSVKDPDVTEPCCMNICFILGRHIARALWYRYEGTDRNIKEIIKELENRGAIAAPSIVSYENERIEDFENKIEVKLLLYNSFHAFKHAIMLYIFVELISFVCQRV